MSRLIELPALFIRARVNIIEEEIEKLPVVKHGKHRDISVLRIYYKKNGKCRHHECPVNSEKGQQLLRLKKRRDALLIRRDQWRSLLTNDIDIHLLDLTKVHTIFDKRFWESVHVRSEFESKSTGYRYKDMIMDSRAEMIVAQTLDSLGMEYKYEPQIIINGEIYYPDFLVYLPEFNRCFFVEFLGKLDKEDYRSRNKFKLMDYLGYGMVINKDLLLFGGTANDMVSADEMTDDIIALLKKYCRMYSVYCEI